MYQRTTIVLPPRLKEKATAQANKEGISFSEFVRRAVDHAVSASPAASNRTADPFFADRAVFRGKAPHDTAANHDSYLYGDQEN